MIRPDGKITMPFLGDVMAAGLTPLELEQFHQGEAEEVHVDPDVSVSVTPGQQQELLHPGRGRQTGGFPLLVPTKVLEAW